MHDVTNLRIEHAASTIRSAGALDIDVYELKLVGFPRDLCLSAHHLASIQTQAGNHRRHLGCRTPRGVAAMSSLMIVVISASGNLGCEEWLGHVGGRLISD
jgi:hypothetical protein